jgi:hypothetical protein
MALTRGDGHQISARGFDDPQAMRMILLQILTGRRASEIRTCLFDCLSPVPNNTVDAAEGEEVACRLANKLGTYLRPGVLVVDEVGYEILERGEANLVFQVISKRYEKGSIILTSNKTFSEWGQVFGDEVLATAILDRLLHHCDVISINGPSYRLKNRLKAIERDTNVA